MDRYSVHTVVWRLGFETRFGFADMPTGPATNAHDGIFLVDARLQTTARGCNYGLG